jgi:hypothetical protein
MAGTFHSGPVGPSPSQNAGIRRARDNVHPAEVVRPGEHPGRRGAVDVLDEIRVVVALRKSVGGVVVRGITAAQMIVAGRAAAAGADEDELPVLDAQDVVPGGLRDRPLPARDVDAGILEVPGLDGGGPDKANVDRLIALRR